MFACVSFFGTQRLLTKVDKLQVPLLDTTRVADVLRTIQERFPDLALKEGGVLATVNNEISSLEQILRPEDNVSFMPFIGGG